MFINLLKKIEIKEVVIIIVILVIKIKIKRLKKEL